MRAINRFRVASIALALVACDFKVTNPGPVADAALDDAGAWAAIVRGVQYNISRATSINSYYSAVAAKEFSTAGRVIATKLPLVFGQLSVDDMSANGYTWSQAARWQAEDGVRRLREVLGAGFASNRVAAQLLMLAALANRMLGECFCESVIDGGAAGANSVYLTRAEGHATEAIAVANAVTPNTAADVAIRQAAQAIRASVRLYQGNFAGANTDAGAVPASFATVNAPFDEGTQNIVVQANDFAIGGSFRAHTAWRSYFDQYFRTTGDLRVRWDSQTVTAGCGTGIASCARQGEFTGITWYFQRKYTPTLTTTDRGAPIRIISQREMRLIEAEVALRNTDFATTATILNALRVGQPVQARTPALPALTGYTITNVREGWNALRKERSIELWLEGRTMGDLRRWIADGTYAAQFDITPPGTGIIGSPDDVSDRVRLCFPISRAERQTNANLPLDPGSDVLGTNKDPKSSIYTGASAPW